MSKPEEHTGTGSPPRQSLKRPRPEDQGNDKHTKPVVTPAPAGTTCPHPTPAVQYAPWPGYVTVPTHLSETTRHGAYTGGLYSGYVQPQADAKTANAQPPTPDGQRRHDPVAWHPGYQQPSHERHVSYRHPVRLEQVAYAPPRPPPPPHCAAAHWQQGPPGTYGPTDYGSQHGYVPSGRYSPPSDYHQPGYPVAAYGPPPPRTYPPNVYAPPTYHPPPSGYVAAQQGPAPTQATAPATAPAPQRLVGTSYGYETAPLSVDPRGTYHPQTQLVYVQGPQNWTTQPPRGVPHCPHVPPYVYSTQQPQPVYRTAQSRTELAKDAERIKSLSVERELDNLTSRRPKRRRRPHGEEANKSNVSQLQTAAPSNMQQTAKTVGTVGVVTTTAGTMSTVTNPSGMPVSVPGGVQGEGKYDLKSKRSRDPGKSSRYRGVSWNKWNNAWKACIKVKEKKKTEHIGYFDDEEDAARAYDIRAIQYRGDKAQLNFPSSAYNRR